MHIRTHLHAKMCPHKTEIDRDVYQRGDSVHVAYRIHNESTRNVTDVVASVVQRESISGPGLAAREYVSLSLSPLLISPCDSPMFHLGLVSM